MSVNRFPEPVPPTPAAPESAPAASEARPRLVSTPPSAALREPVRDVPRDAPREAPHEQPTEVREIRRDDGRDRLRQRPELPDHLARNPGIPLDLGLVRAVRVNRSAAE